MKTTGYSGKPLLSKLSYLPGDKVFTKNAPKWFVQDLHRQGIINISTLPTTWAHLFFKTEEDLRQFMNQFALDKIEKAIWVSWPKKASKISTDITEQTLRDIILPLGWVDVKVVSLDETWSGLKFTRRISK